MKRTSRRLTKVETWIAAPPGRAPTWMDCPAGAVIFSNGDAADAVLYVLNGVVTLSVSESHEAVVAVLRSGDFFGEECLAGRSIRTRTATAMTRSTIFVIRKAAMVRRLRTEPLLARRFMAHLLSRKMRVEDDLIDQLVSSTEQRLARTLLILAGYGDRGTPKKIIPRTSQATLAGIVGSTRPRINRFLKHFETLGFIEMGRSLIVHRSLLRVVSPGLRRSLRDRAKDPRSSGAFHAPAGRPKG